MLNDGETVQILKVGYGNFVNKEKVVAITSVDSAPIKRIISEAKEKGLLIDTTKGRKSGSVIIAESGHIILSYMKPEDLQDEFLNKSEDN